MSSINFKNLFKFDTVSDEVSFGNANNPMSITSEGSTNVSKIILNNEGLSSNGFWFGDGSQAKGYIGSHTYAVNGLTANDFGISSATNGALVFGIAGTEKMRIDTDGHARFHNNLTVSGNFYVNGTTTTINSTTLAIDDKNIELGKGSGSEGNDAAMDGAGITVKSSDSDKTILWNNANNAWQLNQHLVVDGNIKSSETFQSVAATGYGAHFARTDNAPAIKFLGINSASSLNWTIGISAVDGNNNKLSIKRVNDADAFTAEPFTILSDGNVGIGTTDPSSPLHVSNVAANTLSLTREIDILGIANGASSKIEGGALAGASPSMGAALGFTLEDVDGTDPGVNTKGSLYFETKDGGASLTEKMRIDDTGNVGIGTSDPSGGIVSGKALEIKSSAASILRLNRVNGQGATVQDFSLYAGSAAFVIHDNNADESRLVIKDGKVGIGTGYPSSYNAEADNLVVKGPEVGVGITIVSESSAAGKRGNIYFADGISGSEQYRGGITYDHDDDDLSLRTAGTERVWVDNGGSVGIGTNLPEEKLDVDGRVRCNDFGFRADDVGYYYFDDFGGSTFIGKGLTDPYISLYHNSKQTMVWKDGKVGIGTTDPDTKLDINEVAGTLDVVQSFSKGGVGQARIGLCGATSQVLAGALADDLCIRSDGHNIKFGTASATRTDMTIASDGNVGIGVGVPFAPLHVRGPGDTFDLTEYDGYNSSSTGISGNPITHTIVLDSGETAAAKGVGPSISFRGQSSSGLGSSAFATIVGAKENADTSSDTVASKGYLGFYTTSSYNYDVAGADTDADYGTVMNEAMRITSAGDVGIGTALPEGKFHIKHNDFTNVLIESTGTDTDADLWFQSKTKTWRITNDEDQGNVLSFASWTAPSFRSGSAIQNPVLSLSTDGTVKIGTHEVIHEGNIGTYAQTTATSNTWRGVTVDTSGNGSANATLEPAETLMLKKGSNVSLAEAGGVVTISATNTTYSVGDGGLTQNNFTNDDHTKLNGIAASANNYSHPTGDGNKHIPTGGSAGDFLKYDSAGTAVWASATGDIEAVNIVAGTGLTGSANTESGTHTQTLNVDFTETSLQVGKIVNNVSNTNILTVNGKNTSGQSIIAAGDVIGMNNASDDRLKTNINKIDNALDKVASLEGFSFDWNDAAKEVGITGEEQVGLSAQTLEKVLPQVVKGLPNSDYKMVDYQKVVPLLVEAIKELKSEIEELKSK